jgi:hypothetical protein
MNKLVFSFIPLLLSFSCSKVNIDNKNENQIQVSNSLVKSILIPPNLDSIARMNSGAYLKSNLTKKERDSIAKVSSSVSVSSISFTIDTLTHYTVSTYIHFVIVSNTTYPVKYNHPTLSVGLPIGYVLVGGGALAHDKFVSGSSPNPVIGDGAFLTESRPNGAMTLWKASSKDHINPDPHYLTVFAIGMKIDGISATDLKSRIHLDSATSSIPANHPSISKTIPGNCILIGGGAWDNYGTGYGNLLVDSYPSNLNTWSVQGKDHRRPNPCTITAYAIGIENISYPNVGYIQLSYPFQTPYTISYNETSFGPLSSDTYNYNGWALTCMGGHVIYSPTGYGRMMMGLCPDMCFWPGLDAVLWSKDQTYQDVGSQYTYALKIRKAQ